MMKLTLTFLNYFDLPLQEFVRGGVNFFDENTFADRRRTSGFALLVKRASKDPEKYLEKFKVNRLCIRWFSLYIKIITTTT
jgi:hypothetical protein